MYAHSYVYMQVEYPVSEMLGNRNTSDFGIIFIWVYLHRFYWLNISNLKSQNLKCFFCVLGFELGASHLLGTLALTS
jgi:hypothetical protein